MPTPSPSRPSTRSHRFDEIPAPRMMRSSFDLSRKRKTTFDSGNLVPLCLFEVIPGDTFNVNASFFGRLQTLDFPILDNMYFDTFWFFCPNRILWTNWPRFLGALEPNNDSSIDFAIPTIDWDDDTVDVHSLADYFGLPINFDLTLEEISALPFRMYNRIWNEWFRAQELQDSPTISVSDGPDLASLYTLKKRGKRHDYISSCLIAPQRGDGVPLPIGDSAPVIGNGTSIGLTNVSGNFGMATINAAATAEFRPGAYGVATGTNAPGGNPTGARSVGLTDDPLNSGLFADLSEAIAGTINDMREMVTLQQMLERDARGGTRYVERIFNVFGVVVPDFTAQRPEYLGGSIDRVGILQVPQTTASPVTPTMSDAKGALAAYAQIQASSGFNRSFVEHGFVMCLGSLRADLTYQERIDKMWTRSTRFDFYDPMMAHLGEQAVLNKEVFYGTGSEPNNVFGYQERYAEYRSALSDVTGKFRSNAAGTLEAWHLGLDLSGEPVLNDTFIEDNPPLARVLAVTTEPQCLMDMAFHITAARPMPVYGVPGLERF